MCIDFLEGLILKCKMHEGCQKSRSMNLWSEEFGDQAAELFLGAWMSSADSMPVERHRAYRPPLHAVRENAASLGP